MRLRLSGTEQGLTTYVSTQISGSRKPRIGSRIFNQYLPDFPHLEGSEPTFPSNNHKVWEASNISLANYLDIIHEQRILDTALDAMSKRIDGDTTEFYLSRQASIKGKVAFPVGENNEPWRGNYSEDKWPEFSSMVGGSNLARWKRDDTKVNWR